MSGSKKLRIGLKQTQEKVRQTKKMMILVSLSKANFDQIQI